MPWSGHGVAASNITKLLRRAFSRGTDFKQIVQDNTAKDLMLSKSRLYNKRSTHEPPIKRSSRKKYVVQKRIKV